MDRSWKLRVYCREGKGDAMKKHRACTAYIDVNLETLAWTRGRAYPIARLESRMRCIRCGSRRVALYFEPPSEPARRSA